MLSIKSIIFFSTVLVLVLISSFPSGYAFAHYASNNSTGNSTGMMGNTSISSNVVEIIIVQHLIEVDHLKNEGYLTVSETIIFRNVGTQNYTGPIYTWLQDDAFNLVVTKNTMAMDSQGIAITSFQVDDNIIGWDDSIQSSMGMPSMYHLEYMIPVDPDMEKEGSIDFIKKITVPATVNYNYVPMTGMYALVINTIQLENTGIMITDGDGVEIEPDLVEEANNLKKYNWVSPSFDQICIEISESKSGGSSTILYAGIILVIIGVVGYFLLKRNGQKEEKVKHEGEDAAQYNNEEEVLTEKDIENYSLNELKASKKAVSRVLRELDDDFSSSIISEDEYDTIRSNYKKKAVEITKRIEMLEKEQ
ncbi:MAG: hypothetical protein KAJ93_06745 [Methanosarcinales archaeon]|nr:hypothetical protein [Methanosarcinales archaeon]